MTLPPTQVAHPDLPDEDGRSDAQAAEETATETARTRVEMRSVSRRARDPEAPDVIAHDDRRARVGPAGPATGSDAEPTGPRDPRAPLVRPSVVDVAVAAVLLAFGYLVTSGMWHSPTSLTPLPNGTDQAFFEWMLTHAVRVFTHGENPFFSSQLNAPLGVNLMSNTGLLGLAIPLAPLTALIGPSAVFVLIIMLGLSGTAYAWYHVLSRHVVGNRVAALVGGLFCGFGPGIMTHANAHPNLTAQFVLPFILWRAIALRFSLRPVRDGMILGLLVAYQLFLNEELLFLTALAGSLFVLFYVVWRPRIVRESAGTVAIGLTVGAITAFVLVLYPLWYQFYGRQHFSGLPLWLQAYRLPLSSYVTSATLTLFGKPTDLATGTEQNSFIGPAMCFVALAIIVLCWRRRPEVRALGIIAVLFAWASLGDRVSINKYGDRGHPWSLWSHLNKWPLFDSVLPSRLALVLVPVIGVLLAIGTADAIRLGARGTAELRPVKVLASLAGVIAVATAMVTVLPMPVKVGPRPTVPHFFTSGEWRAYVPAGSSVLSATPYDMIPTMQWAIAAKLDLSIPGGYFLGPEAEPKNGDPNQHRGQFGPQYRDTMKVLGSVGSGQWELKADLPYWKTQAVRDLKFWHTSLIVLTLGQAHLDDAKSAVDRLLGPGQLVDDVWIWDVRWTWTA